MTLWHAVWHCIDAGAQRCTRECARASSQLSPPTAWARTHVRQNAGHTAEIKESSAAAAEAQVHQPGCGLTSPAQFFVWWRRHLGHFAQPTC
jgi:hypothetical protein